MRSIDQLRFRFPRAVAAVEARIAFFTKAITFGMVGVVNTLVDFCIFWIAAQEFGLPLVVSNVISWTIAVSGSYVLNSMITFAAESGRKLGWRPYGTFLASGVVGLIANTATLLIAARLAAHVIEGPAAQLAAAKVCAIAASFVVNFSLSHFVVFRRRVETAEGS